MVNKTTNDWTTHDVPDKNIRSFIIDDGSEGQCSEYDVYVTAFTDIGDTVSSIVHTGLSKGSKSENCYRDHAIMLLCLFH